MGKSYFGRTLLISEALWALLWFSSLFVFQLHKDTSESFRASFAITAFHFVNPLIIYSVVRRVELGKTSLPWINFFVLGFALATDLNSLLEAILHLPSDTALWGLIMGITIFAMAMSSVTFVWFSFLYSKYGSGAEKIRNPALRFNWGGKNTSP